MHEYFVVGQGSSDTNPRLPEYVSNYGLLKCYVRMIVWFRGKMMLVVKSKLYVFLGLIVHLYIDFVVLSSICMLCVMQQYVYKILLDHKLYIWELYWFCLSLTLSLSPAGSETVLEVLKSALESLCVDLDSKELNLMFNCLYREITDSVINGGVERLSRLLSLLVSTVQVKNGQRVSGE